MKMKFLALVAALVLANVSHGRANVVYDVHDTYVPNAIPTITYVDGTITTDGNFGVLSATDILAWNLTISSDTHVPIVTLTNANPAVSVSGSGLTATPLFLLFNYNSDPKAFLKFTEDPSIADSRIVYESEVGSFGALGCAPPVPGLENCEPGPAEFRSGIGIVGVATPLPAALPLFATGLCALGLLGWGRKRKQVA
jgi:hypothetical protein